MNEITEKTIDIEKILRSKMGSKARYVPGLLVGWLKKIIHQDQVNAFIWEHRDESGVEWLESTVRYLKMDIRIIGKENLPPKDDGKLYTFVSNHPLGGLDGICLSAIIGGRFDGKIRYLVNDLLLYLSNLRAIFVPINKHGAQGKKNAELIEKAYASDNQIITFPAGLCSRKQNGKIQDTEWKKSFIQKAVEYRRDIVPVFFEGRNSNFFYRLANMRKALGIKMNYEMIYLPDEMFKSKHKTYSIHFGKPIPWQTFDSSRKPAEWAEWVKEIVYNLKK